MTGESAIKTNGHAHTADARKRGDGNRAKLENPLRPRCLNSTHAAAYLGISVWELRDLVRSGALPIVIRPGHKPGRRVNFLIAIEDLDNFVTKNKQTHPAALP